MSTRHKISGVMGIVVGIGKICSTIARRTNSRSICKQQVTCVQWGFFGGPGSIFRAGTLLRMLPKWSHSTDNFIAHELFVIEICLRTYCRYASCCWLGWAPAAFGVGHVRGDVYVGEVRMHGATKKKTLIRICIYCICFRCLTAAHSPSKPIVYRALRVQTSRKGPSRGHVPRPVYPSPGPLYSSI
jgi:hypothetical protein